METLTDRVLRGVMGLIMVSALASGCLAIATRLMSA